MTVVELRKKLEGFAAGARVLTLQDDHYDVLDVVPSLTKPGEEVGLVIGYNDEPEVKK